MWSKEELVTNEVSGALTKRYDVRGNCCKAQDHELEVVSTETEQRSDNELMAARVLQKIEYIARHGDLLSYQEIEHWISKMSALRARGTANRQKHRLRDGDSESTSSRLIQRALISLHCARSAKHSRENLSCRAVLCDACPA